jgi:hypothetical protein
MDGLNQFACEVEEALGNTALQLEQAIQREQAVRSVMTDPDRLAAYTSEFFGPNGPYPLAEAQAEAQAQYQQQVEAQYQAQAAQQQEQFDMMDPRIRPNGAGLDSDYARQLQPIGAEQFQRPQFPGTPQGQPAGQADISVLNQAYSQNPQEAWRLIDQLDQMGAFRGAILAADN